MFSYSALSLGVKWALPLFLNKGVHMESYVDKRVKRSVTDIKEAFLQVLKQKSFKEITISEIIREANYSRGTFYAHFESKEQVLDQIISETLQEMIEQIKVPYKQFTKVNLKELKLEDIMLFEYFIEHATLYKLLLSQRIQVDFRYQMAKSIEQLFLTEYEYVIDSKTLDIKWLYIYRSHGLTGMIIRWIEDDFRESSKFMSQQVVELMLTSTPLFYVK
jgi:AcrR family transcriptional regulator